MSLQPVFSNLDATLTLQEVQFDSGPVRIDADVSVNNPDSTGFNGGRVTISLGGATADDHLGIANVGGISVSGNIVRWNGVAFGTIVSDGSDGSPLTIDLYATNVRISQVRPLLQAVTLNNTSDNPPAGARTLSFDVRDTEGDVGHAEMAISIAPSGGAAPVFSNLNASLTLQEAQFDSGPVRIDTDVSVNNPDSTGFNGGRVTISLGGATADDHLGIANVGGISVSGAIVRWNGVAFGTIVSDGSDGSALTIDLYASNVRVSQVRPLLQAVTLNNTSDNPPAGARTLSFDVRDSEGDVGHAEVAVTIAPKPATSVVFVDSAVSDYAALVAQIPSGTAIVVLDHGADGVAQISDWLAGRTGIQSVHILSNGLEGQALIGSGALSLATLAGYSGQIAAWGASLSATADILFYGCDIAASPAGQSLLTQLAALTGADVAASTDRTGGSGQGGDWVLEHHVGTVGATPVFGVGTSYSGLLDPIVGTEEGELIEGTEDPDDIFGLGGDDDIRGLEGADVIRGGDGSDVIRGDEGSDTLYGGDESEDNDFDDVWYHGEGGSNGVTVNFRAGSVTHAGIPGGTIAGETAYDTFGDTDTIIGFQGLAGTDLGDFFFGSGADELFRPFAGNDHVDGGGGSDEVGYHLEEGAFGVVVNLSGVSQTDEYYGLGAVVSNTARDSYGDTDTLVDIENIRGSNNADYGDFLYGSAGDNRFRGLAGDDFIDGGDGRDTIRYESDFDYGGFLGVFVDLGSGSAADGFGYVDTFVNIEDARGTRFDDTLIGDGGANQLRGEGGNDRLEGRAGEDDLRGGGGSDWLEGGAGGDILDGTPGEDDPFDFDIADYANDPAFPGDPDGVIVNLSGNYYWDADFFDSDISEYGRLVEVGDPSIGPEDVGPNSARDGYGDTDELIDMEGARGSAFEDALIGSGEDFEAFWGLAGDDRIFGGDGYDEVRYEQDADFADSGDGEGGVVVNLSGNFAWDRVFNPDTNEYEGQLVAYDPDYVPEGQLIGPHSALDGFGDADALQNIEGAWGTNQNDVLIGNSQDNFFAALAGDDIIYGGGGGEDFDTVDYSIFLTGDTLSTFRGVSINLSDADYTQSHTIGGTPWSADVDANTALDPYGFTDQVFGIEAVRGNDFDDIMIGDGADNHFVGFAGADYFDGQGGFDTVDFGETLFEEQYGVIVNLSNADVDFAGPGIQASIPADWQDYLNGQSTVYANEVVRADEDDGYDIYTYSAVFNIERVDGTHYADILIGAVDARLVGGGGDDLLIGLSGFVGMEGGEGTDTYIGSDDTEENEVSFRREDGESAVVVNLSGGQVLASDINANIALVYAAEPPSEATFGSIDGNTAFDTYGNVESLTSIEEAVGSHHNDFLIGNDADNRFTGLEGADYYDGGAGSDLIVFVGEDGGDGVVVDLAAGTATDTFGNDETLISIEDVRGSMWGDTITGNAERNRLMGLAGDDILDGDGGRDLVRYDRDVNNGGGNLGVVVNLSSGDYLVDALAAPTYGEAGAFTVFAGTARDGFGDTDTLSNIEEVRGTEHADDILIGNDDDNTLEGFGGNDLLFGNGGSDDLFGGGGNDELFGGADEDRFVGGAGNDTIEGSDFSGEDGFDQVDYSSETGGGGVIVNLATQSATDTFGDADTLIDIEFVIGTGQADSLTGDDQGGALVGLAGDDVIDGAGTAEVRYDLDADFGGNQGVVVDLAGGTATDGFNDTDTLENIWSVRGTQFADDITGDGQDNRFRALAGNDVIDGGGGWDLVDHRRDAGPESIAGVIVNLSDRHWDTASGTLIETPNGGDDVLAGTARDGLGDTDTLTSIERAFGTEENDDVLIGNDERNELVGFGGSDTLIGLGGDDDLDAGAGNDNVDAGDGEDFIQGGVGEDFVDGGADYDVLGFNGTVNAGPGSITVTLADGVAGGGTIAGTIDAGAVDTEFVNMERVEGTAGDDTFLAGPGTEHTDEADTVWFRDHGEVRLFSVAGNGGDDTFTDTSGAPGGVFQINYDAEKFAHGDYGDDWGDDSGGAEPGVIVNLSALTHFDVGPNRALDTFGNLDTIAGVQAFRLTDAGDRFFAGDDAVNVEGRAGDDVLNGGLGNDNIHGGEGNDTLTGGDGEDHLEGGAGIDSYDGGADIDDGDHVSFFNEEGPGGIVVNFSGGPVTAGVYGSIAANQARDSYGNLETIVGVEGATGTNQNDFFFGNADSNFFEGHDGADHYDGGGGDFEQVSYANEEGGAGVIINLTTNISQDTYGNAETFANINVIRGSRYADSITGDGLTNTLRGLAGDDTLDGAGGYDILRYDRDVDHGGNFGVIVNLGVGPVVLGGAVAEAFGAAPGETITVTTGTARDGFGDTDTISNFEDFRGTGQSDLMFGGDAGESFEGLGGADQISGGGGEDRFRDASRDGQTDTLTGGADSDTYFVDWQPGAAADVVTDFATGEGGDLVELDRFVELAGFDNSDPDIDLFAAGYLRLQQMGVHTHLQFDADGAGSGSAFTDVLILQNTAPAAFAPENFSGDQDSLNDAPFVNGVGNPQPSYTENAAPVAIAPSLSLADVDDATLSGATVSIGTGFAAGQDVLNFIDQNGIEGEYNATSGVLALTGTASVAAYQAALRSVGYANSSENPTIAARTISFEVNDGGDSNNLSNVASRTLGVTRVNDAPVAAITPVSYNATEQVSLSLKNSGLAVSDVDSNGGSVTATLAVTAGVLNVTAGSSGASVTGSGGSSVTITGTVAQINALLNTNGTSTVAYINNSDTPGPSATLTLSVNDNGNTGGGALSGNDTAAINITAVNDAPVNTVPGAQSATRGLPFAIAGIAVLDIDSVALTTTLSVAAGLLAIGNDAGATVTGSGTGSVVISGTAAQINAALGSLTYTSLLTQTAPVTLTVTTTDGTTPDVDIVTVNVPGLVLQNQAGNVFGGALGDYLTGNGGVNALRGFDGADFMDGGGGADQVHGEGGNDNLTGGLGDDQVLGGLGNDTLFLGDGNDQGWGGDGNDSIQGGVGNDRMFGEAGDDIIDGGIGDDYVTGGIGNDTMTLGDGFDQAWGGDGVDIIDGGGGNDGTRVNGVAQTGLAGGAGNDSILGGLGDDNLWGDAGLDTLEDGGGVDHMMGGDANDTLIFTGTGAADLGWGGTGADRFVFRQGFGGDRIKDYSVTSGDLIVFEGFGTGATITWTSIPLGGNTGTLVTISTGLPGDGIILEGVNAATVTQSEFLLA